MELPDIVDLKFAFADATTCQLPPASAKLHARLVHASLLPSLRLSLDVYFDVIELYSGTAGCPRLRSKLISWCFDVLDPDVVFGNLHVHQCLGLLISQASCGHDGILETLRGGLCQASSL